jgi:type IV pilus biogenesis/stability protein PilW
MKARVGRDEKRSRAERRRGQTARALGLLADKYWFSIIFAIALSLRLVYLWQIEAIPLFYHLAGDGRAYDEWAQRIAAGDWLGTGVFYQAPLYPYFLGVLQLFLGHSLGLIRFLQIILGSLACALTFRIGQKLFSRRAGIAAGLILAFYAPAIFFDGLIEKSILDLILITVLLDLLVAANKERSWARWVGAGVVLGLLGLSRENALILAPVIGFWIWLSIAERSLAGRLRYLGLFLGGMLLILFPIGLRNFVAGGEFKLTTSQFGPNFFIGNNAGADGTYGSIRNVIGETQLEGPDAKRLAERAAGQKLTAGEVSSYWFERSLDYIKSRPSDWLRLLGLKWLLVWNSREIEDSDDFYIYQNFSWLLTLFAWFDHFGILAPVAALGVVLTWQQWRKIWLLYGMMVALAASVALFYVFGRYRFPLVPLLALLAGAGVTEVWQLLKARAWRPLLPALAVLLVAEVIVNWPIRAVRGPGAAGYNNLANAYSKQGKVDQAITTALKAIEVQPDYGVAHYNLGNLYAQESRFDAAQKHYEEALRLLPNYAEAHSNYGQLLAERGQIEIGMEHFRKAIALNPTISRANLNLGVALAKLGRTEEAIEPLQEAVRLAPDSSEASYTLGSVYAAQSRYAEAESMFRQALQIQPDFLPARRSLAQLLAVQGKKDEALKHYQEALRLSK